MAKGSAASNIVIAVRLQRRSVAPNGHSFCLEGWGFACKSCFVAGTVLCESVFDLFVVLCDLGVSQGILASPRSNTGAEVQAPYSDAGMKAIARFQRASERSGACKRRSIPIREVIRSGMELRSFAL